jgi:indolepyruvate ferredoxin oxidoreductase, beta subunit
MSLHETDPLNLIIAGTGGQGNILISKLLGDAMLEEGYWVTIGETYGASQRGGSVASHVRISREAQCGPITPQGAAHIVLGLEPVEALRILALYGSPGTCVVTNVRPVHPMAVAIGEAEYPRLPAIKQAIGELSRKAFYIDASQIAIDLGAPLLTNMVMTGALAGCGLIRLEGERFERQLENVFQTDKLALNLKAFRLGLAEIKKTNGGVRPSSRKGGKQ